MSIFDVYKASIDEVRVLAESIVRVYASAYMAPPYNETAEDVDAFRRSWRERTGTLGFRVVVAREGDQIVGMAYGWTCVDGSRWNEVLASGLGPTAQTWLADCFEFVDLAVLASYRGHGLGGRLIAGLLHGLPHETSVLLTSSAVTTAHSMYIRRGWQVLCSDFDVGREEPFVIMGTRLQ